MLSAVQALIMPLDKTLLLILHIITKEIEYSIYYFHIYVVVKVVCLWKSHNLDKSVIDTYMRVTVNKGICNLYFDPKTSYEI